MKSIDVGIEFSPSLTNRDELQRDGTFSGEEFRNRYLKDLEDENIWKNEDPYIILDFGNVERLGPSWANEVFAYFTQFAHPELILKKIHLKNITPVKKAIIDRELSTGYRT